MDAKTAALLMCAAINLSACTAEPACIAGESYACVCTDGRAGAQVCQPDGTFADCQCAGTAPVPPTPGSPPPVAPASCDDGGTGEMAYVPTATFMMGCNAALDPTCAGGVRNENDEECNQDEYAPWFEECPYADESPAHVVTISAFEIDRTEVTQAEYEVCVSAGACQLARFSPSYDPARTPTLPFTTDDSNAEAETYCAFVGKRLPTEAEWELAARWVDGRVFPWGTNDVDCSRANIADCNPGALPVGSVGGDRSPCGVMDMAGNVREWVADGYDPLYYRFSPANNPFRMRIDGSLVVRGGDWDSGARHARTSNRAFPSEGEDTGEEFLPGFRCARSAP